jgi:hypothetical protein
LAINGKANRAHNTGTQRTNSNIKQKENFEEKIATKLPPEPTEAAEGRACQQMWP